MPSPLKSNWTLGDLLHWVTSAFDAAAHAAEQEERGAAEPWARHLVGMTVYDRRDEVRSAAQRRGRPRPPRPWSKIDGFTVHQTASGHLDPDHPGVLSVPAHLLYHQDASLTLLHPMVLRMPHGHALNETIGLEIDCREYGVEGDPRTFWRSKEEKDGWKRDRLGRKKTFVGIKRPEQLHMPMTSAQIEKLPNVLDYIAGALIAHGRPPTPWVHRQGHKSRENDPGERPARAVIDWASSRGIEPRFNETRGSGKPWRPEWQA